MSAIRPQYLDRGAIMVHDGRLFDLTLFGLVGATCRRDCVCRAVAAFLILLRPPKLKPSGTDQQHSIRNFLSELITATRRSVRLPKNFSQLKRSYYIEYAVASYSL
jgi:hypothetical protein